MREAERLLLMAVYLLLVIACYTITKAVRDSLFVTRIGPAQLPYVYLLIAAAMGGVSWVYSKVVVRIGPYSLIRTTSIIAIATLVLFWVIVEYDPSVLFYILYVWVSLFGAITASQAWLLATHVFNPREARRVFAWVGAGGIVGGILGGGLTRVVAPWSGTESLLLVCAVLMSLTIVLLQRLVVKTRMDEVQRQEHLTSPPPRDSRPLSLFQQVRESRHLTVLALLLGLGVIVESFIDYEFKTVAGAAFTSKDQLTAFFGTLATYIGVFSILFQLLVTNHILKRFGVTAGIVLLPIGLLVAFIVLALRPSLWSAAILQVVDGSLSYSVHRSSTELLYLPVPGNVRNAVKGFIDTFMDRFGRAIGGVLLLLLTSGLSFSIPALSFVAAGILVLWVAAAFAMKGQYLRAFRTALEKKTIRPESIDVQSLDEATTSALLSALSSDDERQVLYALDLLATTRPRRWSSQLVPLLEHPSARVRERTIALLSSYRDKSAVEQVQAALDDPDLAVRAEAIYFICNQQSNPASKLMEFLNDPSYRLAHAAVYSMSRHQFEGRIRINQDAMERALNARGQRGVEGRIAAAALLNVAWDDSPEHREHLLRLLNDPSPEVVKEAIASSGNIRSSATIPALIDKLSDFRLRRAAREALLQFREEALPELAKRLEDASQPEIMAARIPKVLAKLGTQAAANVLMRCLGRCSLPVEMAVLKALNRMRSENSGLVFYGPIISARLEEERVTLTQFQRVLGELEIDSEAPDPDAPRNTAAAVTNVLRKAVKERIQQHVEKVFRLVALICPSRDVDSALHTWTARPEMRWSAIEFLDNVLDQEMKPLVIPLLEESISGNDSAEAETVPRPIEEIADDLMTTNDPLLRTIATELARRLEVEKGLIRTG